MKSSTLLVAAAAASLGGSPALADYVPVYGGGSIDSSTSSTAQLTIKMSYFNVGEGIASNGLMEWGTAGYSALPSLLSPTPAADRLSSNTIYGTNFKVPSSMTANATRAVLWNAAGQIVEMAYPGATNNWAGSANLDANDGGVSVGFYYQQRLDGSAYPDYLYMRPLRWNASGTVATPLGMLGTDSNGNAVGSANAINNAGTAVGSVDKWVDNVNLSSRAVRWAANSTVAEELPQPTIAGANRARSFAQYINTAGTIAGGAYYYSSNGGTIGRSTVRWEAGSNSATVLDSLTTASDGKYGYTYVYGLNDAGTIVGVATPGLSIGPGIRAVRWDAGTTAITVLGLLGTPDASINTYAMDINSAGIIVGMQRAGTLGNNGTAVMWGTDGVAVDLNSFIDPASGWKLIEADNINDSGWIAGIGLFDPDGSGAQSAYERPFLIQVPEPTVAVVALIALPLLRRRR